MKKNKFLFLTIIFALLIEFIKNYIVYPLKTLEEKETNKFESLLSFNSTYTILEIGNPPQKVDFYFNMTHTQINITDEGCIGNNIYKRADSSTFQIAFELEPSAQDDKTKYLVLDELYFNCNLNLTEKLKIREYPFYYSANISDDSLNLCGNIGLAILQYTSYNFESEQVKYYTEELKKLGAGKYQDFSFFNYNGKDYIITDIFLESVFPELFKGVKQVSWLHPSMRSKTYDMYWEISMKEIYYNNIHSKQFIRFELNPLFELILGTTDFLKNITRDYFDSYINRRICKLKAYKEYNIFECDSGKFTNNDIKLFPAIYLSNLGVEYTFILNSTELFIQNDNFWYFQIVFPLEDLEEERFILGRIFMRKYPVKFSPYSRLIGFYLNKNDKNNDDNEKENKEKEENKENVERKEQSINKKNNSKIVFYIIIIIVALIFSSIGIYVGKKIFNPRKRRANELLDDNYEYEYPSDKNNNDKAIDKTEKTGKNEIVSDSLND